MSSDDAPKTVLYVDPGVCKFKTKICAHKVDGDIKFEIVSDCPHVQKLAKELADGVGMFDALAMPFSTNPIYVKAGQTLAHSACPIPSAIIKTAEVAAGMGLKRPVKFEFEG